MKLAAAASHNPSSRHPSRITPPGHRPTHTAHRTPPGRRDHHREDETSTAAPVPSAPRPPQNEVKRRRLQQHPAGDSQLADALGHHEQHNTSAAAADHSAEHTPSPSQNVKRRRAASLGRHAPADGRRQRMMIRAPRADRGPTLSLSRSTSNAPSPRPPLIPTVHTGQRLPPLLQRVLPRSPRRVAPLVA